MVDKSEHNQPKTPLQVGAERMGRSIADGLESYRRWLLEEAIGNQGATARPAVASTSAWRYPYWPAHDIGYEEDE